MYIPEYFEVTERDTILDFIKTNNFGQLISSVNGRYFSSHIPFFFSNDKESLICHISKKNEQWKDLENQEVLITFQGSHEYISPSWQSSPCVPTWNYQAVHVYGKPYLITEIRKLKKIVKKLTIKHEATFDKSWEPEYNESLLNMIVGIEIKITEIQGKYKLSQNHSESNRKQIIKQLQKHGANKLSQAMKNEL
jgi:transcriptional regulator